MSIFLFFFFYSSSIIIIMVIVVIWLGDLFVTQIIYLKHFAWHMSELDHLYWENFQMWKKYRFISGCLRCGICSCLWIVILVADLSFIESACRVIPACRIRSLCRRIVDWVYSELLLTKQIPNKTWVIALFIADVMFAPWKKTSAL